MSLLWKKTIEMETSFLTMCTSIGTPTISSIGLLCHDNSVIMHLDMIWITHSVVISTLEARWAGDNKQINVVVGETDMFDKFNMLCFIHAVT